MSETPAGEGNSFCSQLTTHTLHELGNSTATGVTGELSPVTRCPPLGPDYVHCQLSAWFKGGWQGSHFCPRTWRWGALWNECFKSLPSQKFQLGKFVRGGVWRG